MKEILDILAALNEWGKENLGKIDEATEDRFWLEIYNLNHQLEGLKYAK